MNALRFQFSLDSWMTLNLFCKCKTSAAAKQDVNSQPKQELVQIIMPFLAQDRNGAALKMTFKLSLHSNLNQQSAVNSPCAEQISMNPCTGTEIGAPIGTVTPGRGAVLV